MNDQTWAVVSDNWMGMAHVSCQTAEQACRIIYREVKQRHREAKLIEFRAVPLSKSTGCVFQDWQNGIGVNP